MLTTSSVQQFLQGHRIAVIGASDGPKNFGGTVYRALRDHGHRTIPVHPTARTVAGDAAYRSLDTVRAPVDGVVVMVNPTAALGVVRTCVERGITNVWLFKGIGAAGAMSDEAVQLCEANGINVVEGACPLMFLEPVGLGHRVHRRIRHLSTRLPEPATISLWALQPQRVVLKAEREQRRPWRLGSAALGWPTSGGHADIMRRRHFRQQGRRSRSLTGCEALRGSRGPWRPQRARPGTKGPRWRSAPGRAGRSIGPASRRRRAP